MLIPRLSRLAVTLTAVSVLSFSQDAQRLDPALDQIVGADAKVERIASGFDKWTEGPVWTREDTLLFAEIPANNIIQWSLVGAQVFSCIPAGTKARSPISEPYNLDPAHCDVRRSSWCCIDGRKKHLVGFQESLTVG